MVQILNGVNNSSSKFAAAEKRGDPESFQSQGQRPSGINFFPRGIVVRKDQKARRLIIQRIQRAIHFCQKLTRKRLHATAVLALEPQDVLELSR